MPEQLVGFDTTPLAQLLEEVLKLRTFLLTEPFVFDDRALLRISEVSDSLPVILGDDENDAVEDVLPFVLSFFELFVVFVILLLLLAIDGFLHHVGKEVPCLDIVSQNCLRSLKQREDFVVKLRK